MRNRGIQLGIFIVWVFFIPSIFAFSASESDAQNTEVDITCGSPGHPHGQSLIQSFDALMGIVAGKVNERGWGAESIYRASFSIFALAQCQNDLDSKQCSTCFSKARELLPRCLPATSGRIYLEGCFLRYDNYPFFNESVDASSDKCYCKGPPKCLLNDESLRPGFAKQVGMVVSNVTEAASRRRFALGGERGGVEEVFALAQCWETVHLESCEKCLHVAAQKIQECVPGAEGKCLYTGCFLRYSTYKFYNDYTEESDIGYHNEASKIGFVIAGVLSGIALIFLISLGLLLSWQATELRNAESKNLGSMPSDSSQDGLNFRYEFLEKATDFFDPSRKLGQGGAGSVFKGTLSSGRDIAVKRLFFNTRQWADGFFNEVNLISGIQHKNLVRLMGCSIEGPESLLVYEYLPNRSLDQVLFGKDSADALTWEQRFQIICGIAEGLAYLHGGCGTKIIHRDIKASNILLDDNLVPKIADFGLARFIASDKSHISTGIAGTLGYMAPEYLMRGQLTEKADVYAFGVLIIEIVCGQKNSIFTEGSSSLLHRVWKNYKASNLTASVDPALKGNFCAEEASNALHAGLLCVQSSVSQRSSMAEVLQMLTSNKDYHIPSPKHQPFLNSSVLSPDDRTKTCTMSFLSPNGHAGVAIAENSSYKSPRSSTSSEHSTPNNSLSGTTIGAPEPR